MLAVRSAAGPRADSAELGWYRLLMAAKRYGRWAFASEEHLSHIAGSYYRFVPLYRSAHLLDGLIVHDGDSYNAVKTPTERKADQRERDSMSRPTVTTERDMPRDQNVTLQTERETDREDRQRDGAGDDFDALDVYHELTMYRPWGAWSGDEIKVAQRDYGDAVVQAALRAEWAIEPSRDSLWKRTKTRLAKAADRQRDEARSKPRPIRPEVDRKEHGRIVLALMAGDTSVLEDQA